jgi:hypothetical protein
MSSLFPAVKLRCAPFIAVLFLYAEPVQFVIQLDRDADSDIPAVQNTDFSREEIPLRRPVRTQCSSQDGQQRMDIQTFFHRVETGYGTHDSMQWVEVKLFP